MISLFIHNQRYFQDTAREVIDVELETWLNIIRSKTVKVIFDSRWGCYHFPVFIPDTTHISYIQLCSFVKKFVNFLSENYHVIWVLRYGPVPNESSFGWFFNFFVMVKDVEKISWDERLMKLMRLDTGWTRSESDRLFMEWEKLTGISAIDTRNYGSIKNEFAGPIHFYRYLQRVKFSRLEFVDRHVENENDYKILISNCTQRRLVSYFRLDTEPYKLPIYGFDESLSSKLEIEAKVNSSIWLHRRKIKRYAFQDFKFFDTVTRSDCFHYINEWHYYDPVPESEYCTANYDPKDHEDLDPRSSQYWKEVYPKRFLSLFYGLSLEFENIRSVPIGRVE